MNATGATSSHTASVSVSSGSRKRVTVVQLDDGSSALARSLYVSTDSNPQGDLDVALFDGQSQVAPEEGKHSMRESEVTIPGTSLYDTGDNIDVELDNRDNASTVNVSVLVVVTNPDDMELIDAYGS
jgi:hypothetical protein